MKRYTRLHFTTDRERIHLIEIDMSDTMGLPHTEMGTASSLRDVVQVIESDDSSAGGASD